MLRKIGKFIGVVARLIVAAYKLVMTLIGLVIVCIFAYLFFYNEWREYDEEQSAENRQELIDAAAVAARKRGLGDLEELRRDYLDACPLTAESVLEGDVTEICEAMADALLDRSLETGMTMFDHVQLSWDLCALDAEDEGYDPDEECDRDYRTEEALFESLAYGLCRLDSAWVVNPYHEYSVTRRGADVYRDGDLLVDCGAGLIVEYDYFGYFEGVPDEYGDDYAPVVDRVYEALEVENHAAALAYLDTHEFGADEATDKVLLDIFVRDAPAALLPEVLARNGGRVNFDTDYYDQPLSQAIWAENEEAALILLRAGASPVRPYEYGVAPLVNAAGNGMLELVREMVARGADVDGVRGSETRDFGNALKWAAWQGHEETAMWLLENGAAIAPVDPAQFPSWTEGDLLEHAAEGGDLAVVQALVERGARSEDPLKLFKGALAGANPEVLLLLFDEGYELPDTDRHDRLYDVVTDLVQAESRERIADGVRIFEILLDHGLDMSYRAESGFHYGHQAVRHHAPATVAMSSEKQKFADTYALKVKFVKRVIDEVLAAGIGIDDRFEGETMLMKAAEGAKPELLQYLLDLGADATIRNDKGQTALEMAAQNGRRLISFWDEDAELRARYSNVVELLGGGSELLEPQKSPDS